MLFNAVVMNFPTSTFFKILSIMQSVHSEQHRNDHTGKTLDKLVLVKLFRVSLHNGDDGQFILNFKNTNGE